MFASLGLTCTYISYVQVQRRRPGCMYVCMYMYTKRMYKDTGVSPRSFCKP